MNRKPFLQLIFALVLLAVALGMYAFWLNVVEATSAKAAELRGQIQAKSTDAARIAQARTALQQLSADEATVSQYFVSPDDVVAFLGGLQAAGQALGSTVEVISVSSDNQKPQGHLLLSLKISGSFDSVMRTLGVIEYGPVDIRLTDVTLDTPVGAAAEASSTAAVWTAAANFSVGTLAVSTSTAAAAAH